MMQKWRKSGDFVCKSLINLRSKENSVSRSVSGFVNRYGTKGKIFESNDGNYNSKLDHRNIGGNLGIMMNQYRCFGSASVSQIQGNPLFSSLDWKDVSYFKEILGEKNVIEDEERLETANTDWMHKYKGSSKLMLLPKNTEEVSQILKYCVIQGV